MINAAEIEDRDSLEAWLKDQPREVAVEIAARAALRVMPVWAAFCYSDDALKNGLEPLSVLRIDLILSVAVISPTGEIKSARSAYAARARPAFSFAADAAAAFVYAAAEAAAEAAAAFGADAARAAASAAAYAADAASRAAFAALGAFWQAVRSDAQAAETVVANRTTPLWPDENPLQEVWKKTRQDWSQPNSPYAFWRRWYDSLLDPHSTPPFPDELLYRIALIDNAIWEVGAEAVAAEIASIEAQFDLLEQVRSAKSDLTAVRSARATRALRADNLPEGMEPLADLDAGINDAIAGLDEAEQELEKPKPSRQALKKAAVAIGNAAKVLAVYVGKKADKVLDTFLEESTKQLVKKGSVLLSLGLVDRLFHISEAIAKFADKLPWP